MTESAALPDPSKPVAPAAPAGAIRRGWIRNNVEAFTVAIVMALVIKQFAFEAFQVPTESMEPTILGRTPGGDRIIVNKFTYLFREPERYDVMVFRYPLSRLVNYVKRLVGLPGERLEIHHGDIYTAPNHGTDVKIARKPRAVQEAIFDANPVIPEEVMAAIRRSTFWDSWQRPPSGADIDEDQGTLTLTAGSGELLLKSKSDKGITAERHDRDAADRKGTADAMLSDPIGDLRLEVVVEPEPRAKSVVLRIVDGTQVNMPLRLEVAVDGSPGGSRLTHGSENVGTEPLKALTLKPGRKAKIILENADDRVRVVVDGDEICTYDYVQALQATPGGRSQVSFGLTGGRAVFYRLGLYRDLYYTEFKRSPTTFDIPEGHFLFFGDNSANSLDARAFRMVGIRLREDGTILLGDLEAVADDFDAPRQDNNPYLEMVTVDGGKRYKDPSVHHFRDIEGNHWKLTPGSYDILDLPRFLDEPAAAAKCGTDLLGLHQTKQPKLDEKFIAFAAVDEAALRNHAHDPHSFDRNSVLVHFVRRQDIMGRANLVFLPGAPSLLQTVLRLSRCRVIR